MQNTVNSSAVGTGKQYRLLLERVSNDRTLHLAEVAPKDIIDEDNINEEHSYQTATISHEREEITAEINYGATIVPMSPFIGELIFALRFTGCSILHNIRIVVCIV